MNYSEVEHSGNRTEDLVLIEAGMRLLPLLPPALFGGISRLAQAHHLTPAQMKVLLQVGQRGQMTMGEIACGLSVSMPATSEIVDRLVESGHLTRSSDPTDRRRVLIAPTPESLRITEEMNMLRRSQIEGALAQLLPEERPVFVRALQALLHGLTFGEGTSATPCFDELAIQGQARRPTPRSERPTDPQERAKPKHNSAHESVLSRPS